jgi:Low affinity iron permease
MATDQEADPSIDEMRSRRAGDPGSQPASDRNASKGPSHRRRSQPETDRHRSEPMMPSEVSSTTSPFDKFATTASRFASRAWFFGLCVLLVVIWAPSFFLFGTVDTWQLVINTATTIITFLLVALLQNTQSRSDAALQQKLNALADGLADLMDHIANTSDAGDLRDDLRQDLTELRAAVGLETRESA